MPNNAEILAGKAGHDYCSSVFDGFFYDPAGNLVFKALANTDASVEVSTTKTEKKAGEGGATLWTVISDRSVTASMTAIDIQTEYIAANLGATIQITKSIFLTNKEFRASEGKVTLPVVPSDKKATVTIRGNDIVISGVSGTELDLTAYGITNECVNVTYLYEADGEIVPIPVSSSPMVGRLILKTKLYRSGVGEIGETGWDFPQFQLDGNFTHTTNTSDGGSFEITGSALKDNSGTSCDGTGDTYGRYFKHYYDEEMLYKFSSIIATPSDTVLSAGESETEQIKVYGMRGSNIAEVELTDGVTYTVDKETYATVSPSGLITAVAEGSAVVTCTYKNLIAKVNVTVTA